MDPTPPGTETPSPADALPTTARPAPPPLPRPAHIALAVVPLFVAGLLAQVLGGIAGLAWTQLFVFLLPAAAAAAGANLRPTRFLRLAPRPPASVVGLGFLVGVSGYVLASGIMSGAELLYPARWVEAFDVSRIFQGPLWQSVTIAALASLLAPVCEESAFRGYVQTAVGVRRGPAAAIAASTAVFSLMHLDPVRLPALVVLGATFGWISWRAGSVWPSIAAHAANNGIASLLALFFARRVAASPPRPPLGAVAVELAIGAALLGYVLHAYRAATPAPPPFGAALAPLDPARPAGRFALARLPPRYVALALLGIAAFFALVLAGSFRVIARMR